ncbi:hypothetical protein KFL_010940010 [Klebsormidium nitens]|uniref:Uncharacterized protein n=1 Tax=Klebsormidium nitens TaxID=105231 RepID=A0A1Y1IV03_KLENI|nr:hypothetical protein KFL_010940010 [Klebsormidium nitens]|eukprot:GAQ92686.1 hypothetical protein KFL_010940010 [Klebsormidium nitens]
MLPGRAGRPASDRDSGYPAWLEVPAVPPVAPAVRVLLLGQVLGARDWSKPVRTRGTGAGGGGPCGRGGKRRLLEPHLWASPNEAGHGNRGNWGKEGPGGGRTEQIGGGKLRAVAGAELGRDLGG